MPQTVYNEKKKNNSLIIRCYNEISHIQHSFITPLNVIVI